MSVRVPAGQRTAAVWVPDWPVLVAMSAQEIGLEEPAVTHRGRRVQVVSAFARRFGVRKNMPLRAAQELCPHLHVLDADEGLAAREFEFVAQAVQEVVPEIEILRPGLLLCAARGPAKYYGSEEAVLEAITEMLAERAGCEARVGVSNGILAAILAARAMRVVPEDQTHEFLGPRPLSDLLYAVTEGPQRTELENFMSLQTRLGIATFADLAALPHAHVLTRFGEIGGWAHKLATGSDLRRRSADRQQPDVSVSLALDPPVARVDTAAFVARQLAQELHDALLDRGVSCARIEITARTDAGVELVRTWRTDESALGAMSAARMTQRVRWQLEGWLTASALARSRALKGKHPAEVEPPPAQALTSLLLTAQYVAPMRAHQEALWGRSTGATRRAQGAVERIQDLLGPQAVLAVAATGGRTYQERMATRWWAPEPAAKEAAASWPGQLPSPAPASLLADPWGIDVLDREGRPLRLSNRLALSGQPYAVVKSDPRWRVQSKSPRQPERIGNWAGPWPIRTGWWTQTAQHCVYLQLELPEQPALLVVFRAGAWLCEGIYD